MALAVGVISALDAAWIAVLVLYVIEILQQKPGAYGVLLAVAATAGIAADATGSRISRRLGEWRSLLAGLVMAVAQLILGLTANVIIAASMLAPSSGAWALLNMTAATMRQPRVPGSLLGRVSRLYSTAAGGAEALGALGGGARATIAGIRSTMLVGAVPVAAVTIAVARQHRLA